MNKYGGGPYLHCHIFKAAHFYFNTENFYSKWNVKLLSILDQKTLDQMILD